MGEILRKQEVYAINVANKILNLNLDHDLDGYRSAKVFLARHKNSLYNCEHDFSKDEFIVALKEGNWHYILASCNGSFGELKRNPQNKDTLFLCASIHAMTFLKMRAEILTESGKIKVDRYMTPTGPRIFSELEYRKDELNKTREVIHSVVFKGILGNGTLGLVDPSALLNFENLK